MAKAVSPLLIMKTLLALFFAAISTSCVMNDTAKLKASKTCVIATAITDQADIHSIGITTFNNKQERTTIPGLKKMTEDVLRQELSRFYQVKAVVNVPHPNPAKGYTAAMAASRAQNKADLEVCVYPYGATPVGIPRHLEAEGFGFYSGGASGSGTVVCYQGLVIRDGVTGKDVASPMGENDLGIVPDGDTFSRERYKHVSARKLDLGSISAGALSPEQKQKFLQACRELYREKVRNELWKMELR